MHPSWCGTFTDLYPHLEDIGSYSLENNSNKSILAKCHCIKAVKTSGHFSMFCTKLCLTVWYIGFQSCEVQMCCLNHVKSTKKSPKNSTFWAGKFGSLAGDINMFDVLFLCIWGWFFIATLHCLIHIDLTNGSLITCFHG